MPDQSNSSVETNDIDNKPSNNGETPSENVKTPTISEDKELRMGKVQDVNDITSETILPIRVSVFDTLIDKGGIERGNTIIVSGGCGTGKSTFTYQSCYMSALGGEKCVYITLEEAPNKLSRHMAENYGFDIRNVSENFIVVYVDAFTLARSVEAEMEKQKGNLLIKTRTILDMIPSTFSPDRIVVDSLSALSAAFIGNEQEYRIYLIHLIRRLEGYNSVNFLLAETEQDPSSFSRTGIEEFLVDGVFVLYNIKQGHTRQRALEILKLRNSNHSKRVIPYELTDEGFVVHPESDIFTDKMF